ncbi:hypothetical protein ES703_125629 [subsurface metagenome]
MGGKRRRSGFRALRPAGGLPRRSPIPPLGALPLPGGHGNVVPLRRAVNQYLHLHRRRLPAGRLRGAISPRRALPHLAGGELAPGKSHLLSRHRRLHRLSMRTPASRSHLLPLQLAPHLSNLSLRLPSRSGVSIPGGTQNFFRRTNQDPESK